MIRKLLDRWHGTDRVLAAIQSMRTAMTQGIDDIKAAFQQYTQDVEKLLADQKAEQDKVIADAIAKDDAGEEVELQDVLKEIQDARDRLPKPTVPDVFQPSNQ